MVHRRLGKSGLSVSPIGFGAFKIGRNQQIKYAQPYALPSEREVAALLDGVLALGINYIDTAPAYGLSEERLGQVLGERRREVVISTKVGETFADGRSTYEFSRAAVTASLERSRRRLRLDVLDLVFIHAPADDVAILNETDVVATLTALRDAGHVRAIGLSAKTVAGARWALPWADALMVEYHPHDPSSAPLLAEAAAADVGIVIKKGLGSGSIDPTVAIPFALAPAAVASLVVGSLNLEHLRADVRIATGLPPPPRTAADESRET